MESDIEPLEKHIADSMIEPTDETTETIIDDAIEPIATESINDIDMQHTTTQHSGLLLLHVMATAGQGFGGEKLFQIFRQHRLIYGKKCIFHAHDRAGKILFSVASAVEHGIFDLAHMHTFTTPGLGFFLDLDHVEDPRVAFNHMLTIAKAIAVTLKAQVMDEHYQPLNADTMQYYLTQLKSAERVSAASNVSAEA